GGAQENTLATVRGLKEKGYEVTLVTGPTWGIEGEIISKALEEGFDVMILPGLVRELDFLRDGVVLSKLKKWMKRSHFVIVHTHTSKAGFLGRLAANRCKVPIVIHTSHGHVFHSYFSPLKERLFLRIEQKAADWCDRLIALTEVERNEHLKLRVGRPEKWAVIPSGINEKKFFEISLNDQESLKRRFNIPLKVPVVGFIGRLASIKGPRYLIESIPLVCQILPEAHFVFVGDGDERKLLEQKVREMGISPQVTFTGHHETANEFLNLFDVLVVPSLNEGMGRVIAEAGLLKKPVVGTRVGGILDLIEDRITGLLVNPRNPAGISGAVLELLKDYPLSRRLGEALYERILEGFTENHMVDKIHAVYQEMIKEKKLLFRRPLIAETFSATRSDLIKAGV
ncbi:MAG TPA: glycosyltransferase, partial [bacterium]|nr:glycosyltransferase [bacterium]